MIRITWKFLHKLIASFSYFPHFFYKNIFISSVFAKIMQNIFTSNPPVHFVTRIWFSFSSSHITVRRWKISSEKNVTIQYWTAKCERDIKQIKCFSSMNVIYEWMWLLFPIDMNYSLIYRKVRVVSPKTQNFNIRCISAITITVQCTCYLCCYEWVYSYW